MEMRSTDHRLTNLEHLHLAVVRGKSRGKIIWQPRIGCWLQDKLFEQQKIPEPYQGMSLPEIYRSLGCSARIYEYNECFKKIEDSRVKFYDNKISETQTEHIMETPIGKATSITESSPSSWFYITKKRWVSSQEELEVLAWAEERCSWVFDPAVFKSIRNVWGDLGAPTIFMPRVNVQHLYIDIMGVEYAVEALYTYPDALQRYFQILEQSHEWLIDVINNSPVKIVNFGDNVHASTLSPSLFVKYVLPVYQRRSELLHKAQKFVHAHWDGDTKPLLPYAKETGLDGIEAITPKPQGDVELEEVREALGDKMFLLDGIAATLFNDVHPVERLVEQAKKVIELFAPRLVLGISDEIASCGDLERIRIIGKIVDDYNASLK
ncbi:hypothetical protein JW926_08920 [Candidatus Sumerlaeota bacterium]|nr:hypothetical protein [Candidatus Sumerlaeota bacterium]